MTALSPRQRQVLELLSDGYTSRQTAERLGMAYETFRTHRQDVLRRMKAHTITEACVKYERERAAMEAADLLRQRIVQGVM